MGPVHYVNTINMQAEYIKVFKDLFANLEATMYNSSQQVIDIQ